MQLQVWQHQEDSDDGRIEYVATCTLELGFKERELRKLYGAAPLTEPPLVKPAPHEEPPGALLTDDQFKVLLTAEGYAYKSHDVRQTLAFVEDLKAACRELRGYWSLASKFNASYTDPLGDGSS